MDIYTLTETFLPDRIVDEFVSAIWTERYSKAGDVQIVSAATADNIDMLAEGTYLALRGSKEVMIIESAVIKDKLLTVKGRTFIVFLDTRYIWARNPDSDEADQRVVDYIDDTKKPGEFIADVVYKMVIAPTPFTGDWAPANIDWAADTIDNLTLGPVDTSGVAERLTAPIGRLYEGIERLAEQLGVGISLYLDSADPIAGYSLKFTTYRGVDRTSDQDVNPLVRLSPELDSIAEVEEVRSIEQFRNVAYVYYQGIMTKHLLDPEAPEPEGLERRVLITNAEGDPPGRKTSWTHGNQTYTNYVVSSEDVAAFREQNARDALANANYIRAIDGQTTPDDQFKYGVDYSLGDIIELEGLGGTLVKARITEYIRAHDNVGEREYPTISVIT